MGPLLVNPNVLTWAVGWLQAALDARPEDYADGVLVDIEIPAKERRDRMVILRRNGGTRQDLVYTASRVGANIYAPTDREADDLAGLVEGLLLSVRALAPVEYVNPVTGPVDVEDPADVPRRYLSVELITRGVPA